MTVPIYGDLFVLNWVDLNGTVLDSLGELDSAYRNLRERYEDNVASLAKQVANLQSNINLFTGPCESTAASSTVSFQRSSSGRKGQADEGWKS